MIWSNFFEVLLLSLSKLYFYSVCLYILTLYYIFTHLWLYIIWIFFTPFFHKLCIKFLHLNRSPSLKKLSLYSITHGVWVMTHNLYSIYIYIKTFWRFDMNISSRSWLEVFFSELVFVLSGDSNSLLKIFLVWNYTKRNSYSKQIIKLTAGENHKNLPAWSLLLTRPD